ncbi:hypothetical protein [Novosphingobium sp.]|uniref:hypothetical protein n=1 Tax=Novosphingobium sp. TaxID=1874826 RepID=UPI0038BB7B3A
MTAVTDAPPPAAAAAAGKGLTTEEQRLVLEARRLALEDSWPRKWGSIVVGAGTALAAGLVSLGINFVQAQVNSHAVEQAAKDRASEQDRTVLDMYFKYIDGKGDPRPAREQKIKALVYIAHDDRILQGLFDDLRNTAGNDGQAPSDALQGTPDLKQKAAGQAYVAGDFTSYVQYFDARKEDANKVAGALSALGFTVPGQQAMEEGKSPPRNQIRIYRADHKAFAAALAVQLQQKTGLAFEVVGPIRGALPDGVIEVWIGQT